MVVTNLFTKEHTKQSYHKPVTAVGDFVLQFRFPPPCCVLLSIRCNQLQIVTLLMLSLDLHQVALPSNYKQSNMFATGGLNAQVNQWFAPTLHLLRKSKQSCCKHREKRDSAQLTRIVPVLRSL